MKYPITYKAALTLSWEYRSAIIEIELSDEEVKQIQSVVIPDEVKSTYDNVARQFPEISSKLFDAGLDFMWYAEYLDTRLSGEWEEGTDRNISEKQLMKEDIACNGFDPHNEDGKLLRGRDCYNAWVKWEEEHLESLPFANRSSFYEYRYDIHDLEFDYNACSIYFPAEIINPALERLKKNMEIPTKDYQITFTIEEDELVPSLRTATIPVPLTDEEVQQIQKVVNPKLKQEACSLIRNQLSQLHHKIVSYANDFALYTELVYKRRCLRYYEDLDFIHEEDEAFMKEDMEERGFDPHDENGILLEGDALLQHWMDWEEQQLDGMDYGDRWDYYFDRYGVENDYATSSENVPFYLPESFFKS